MPIGIPWESLPNCMIYWIICIMVALISKCLARMIGILMLDVALLMDSTTKSLKALFSSLWSAIELVEVLAFCFLNFWIVLSISWSKKLKFNDFDIGMHIFSWNKYEKHKWPKLYSINWIEFYNTRPNWMKW